jgi:phage terminase small subunit
MTTDDPDNTSPDRTGETPPEPDGLAGGPDPTAKVPWPTTRVMSPLTLPGMAVTAPPTPAARMVTPNLPAAVPGDWRPLTPREKIFVEEYKKDLDLVKAGKRAGYPRGTHPGDDPVVQAAMDRALQERAERTQIDGDRVLRELGRIAFATMGDLLDDNGDVLPLNRVSADTLAALGKFKKTRESANSGGGVDVGMVDKLKALELLGKHLKLFNDTSDDAGAVGLSERLVKAMQRAEAGGVVVGVQVNTGGHGVAGGGGPGGQEPAGE